MSDDWKAAIVKAAYAHSAEDARRQVREAMGDYDSADDYVLLLGFWLNHGMLTADHIREGLDLALKEVYEHCSKCRKKGLYRSNGYPYWGDGTKRCRYCGHIVPKKKKD